ncbi:MAG: orotidine 5'-phosphate decarboxylase / HUMPS family protein [Nitrososphaerales archaeon]
MNDALEENRSKKSPAPKSFNNSLETASKHSGSRIILALDLEHRQDTAGLLADAKKMINLVHESVCAIKINFHLIIPLSLGELTELNNFALDKGLPTIADIKLNDIDNTNRIATEYLWDANFSAVIVNPFVGFKGGLEAVYWNAKNSGKGVISLAFMSHPGAMEGYGLQLSKGQFVFEVLLDRANTWGSDGVILGTTRPDKITLARKELKPEIKILSPGSGPQGGNPEAAINAGADYLIFGRSIVESKDPRAKAKEIYQKLLSSRGNC